MITSDWLKNRKRMGIKWTRSIILMLFALHTMFFTFHSCTIQPPLHLPDEGMDVESYLPLIDLDLDILWKYDMVIDSVTGEIYDTTYNWRDEFYYGWDSQDDALFGTWHISDPNVFNIRRYYTNTNPLGPHTAPNEHQIVGNRLSARYKFGFYDLLAWNEVHTLDGVQSIHFDESSTYEYVTAYTNKTMNRVHYSPRHQFSYYQPEFLFGGYYEDLEITNRPEDYDYFDEERKAYVKNVKMTLYPRTYIYISQIILHHNRGRIANIDGTANLQGMAQRTNINTGMTDGEEISVNYNQRLKRDCIKNGEKVDIIGGRLFTFGLCNLNPSRATRASATDNKTRNYIDINMIFNNGIDSTFVFDVTDQVHRRYKGGIITIELDVDTIRIPSRKGGSGFDAIVEDFDTIQYEFDM